LTSLRDALIFLGVGITASWFVALFSMLAFASTGLIAWHEFAASVRSFWAGDTLGVIGLGPLLLIYVMPAVKRWLDVQQRDQPLPSPLCQPLSAPVVLGQVSLVVVTLGVIAVSWEALALPPLYLLFIPLIWICVTYGSGGAAIAIAVLNIGIIFAVSQRNVPFPIADLQIFMAVLGITGICLGSLVLERKRAEAALHRAHDKLEARVQARTAELTAANAQLAGEVSAHRQAEQARAESEQRLQALFDNALDAILLADNTGQFIAANPAACQLLGATQAQVLQLTVWDITPSDQRLQAQALWQTFVTADGKKGGEYVLYRQDGTSVVAEYRAVAHILPGLHLSILRDISQRKAAEARAQQHLAALAYTARLNTAGELASGLAHELNQPLCAMIGYAETGVAMLRAKEPNHERLAGMLAKIIDEGVRAGGIMGRLRHFLRKREPERELSELSALVNEAIGLIAPEIQQAAVHLQLNLAEGLPSVYVDTIQIQQIVLNLVYNSLEALQEMPAPQRSITITTALFDNAAVELTVSDTGPGLPPEARTQLFQPFFTTRPTGIGLGLALSRSIAELHGGRLWATPNPERGVTFHCTLPIWQKDPIATPVSDLCNGG
jgi:PAS domain S-box-containing protein